MRGRQISRETLREQILDDGEEFGITAMDTSFGDVVAAEEILTVVPLVPGVNFIEPVQRDITSISQAYPLHAVIASRKKKTERTFAHRSEIASMAYRRSIEAKKEAALHDLKGDVKNAVKGRLVHRVTR